MITPERAQVFTDHTQMTESTPPALSNEGQGARSIFELVTEHARARSLGEYLRNLWELGGISFVFIGLGALSAFVPDLGKLTAEQHLILSCLLFGSGFVSWGALTFLTYRHWALERQFLTTHLAKTLEATVAIVQSGGASDVVQLKTKLLSEAVSALGIPPIIAPLKLPGEPKSLSAAPDPNSKDGRVTAGAARD